MKIVKITLEKIKNFRNDYLNSLPEFQELFIEIMIYDSDCFILKTDAEEIGYVIRNKDGVLVEFYVKGKYIPDSHIIFGHILKELSIMGIYCKSFDSLLLNNCMLSDLPYSILGKLYRDYVEPLIERVTDITMKKAGLASVDFLFSQDQSIRELFETKEQLIDFIQNEHVFEFYTNNEFMGCGMVIRTNRDWNFCDLGVWVNPSNRGNSLGAQILMNLREFAINHNMKPSCGCAIENIASQKTIEKCGFVSRFSMIHFKTNINTVML